jgi:hypothetical protein
LRVFIAAFIKENLTHLTSKVNPRCKKENPSGCDRKIREEMLFYTKKERKDGCQCKGDCR